MAQTRKVSDFFVAGGTLRPDASSYVQRPTDDELFEHVLAGEFCYVLTSRQMGKSSLMIRTEHRLKDEGVKTVIIDLTNIGTDIRIEQWYLGLLSRVRRRLRLDVDLETWWGEHAAFSFLQRFTDFLREVVLTEVPERVVIFIDEIDSTLSLDFRDDFFAGIRAIYNARAEDPNLERLTFVLLGVAAPTELISDRSRTPFNIGHEITLQEFSYDDAAVLQAGVESSFPGQGEAIFKRIFHWTNGHPYLTQRLCLAVTESEDGPWDDQSVDALVTKLFLTEEARKETNLKYAQDRILANQRKIDLLKLYRKVLRGKDVEDDGQSLLQNQLKLSGLVKVEMGKLSIRNQIYRRAFSETWIKENLPKLTPQRIAVIASLLAVIAISIVVYLVLEDQGQEVDVQAQTYIQQFENSQSSDVRLVSLAGLIDLGEPYNQDAETAFSELSDEEQINLFKNISTPDDFEWEIFVTVNMIYQDMPNNQQGNQKLDAMADILGEPRLKTEIELWLQARSLVGEDQPRAALSVYDTAWSMSEEREHPNSSILFEKGTIAIDLGYYNIALADFEKMLSLDATKETIIRELITENPDMFETWSASNTQYAVLSGILPTLTPIPSSTPPPSTSQTQTEVATQEDDCSPTDNGPLAGINPRNQTVVWWHNHSGSPEEVLIGMVNEFNATNPCGITVEPQYQGSFSDIRDRMLTGIAVGELPGLSVAYQNTQAEFAQSDSLVDFSIYIDDPNWGLGTEKDDFYPSFMNHSIHPDNSQLGFAAYRSMEGLYYNITWLQELGFDGSPPRTPGEFHDMACAAADANADGTGGYILRDNASAVAAWTFAFGGDVGTDDKTGYVYNSEATVDAMIFLKELQKEGCAYFLLKEGYSNPEFAARRAIFTQDSSSGIPFYAGDIAYFAEDNGTKPDEWGFTAIPHIPPDPVQNSYGADIIIPKTNPEIQLAAWIFIKWFTTPEQQAEWVKITGYYPTRSTTLEYLEDYALENPQWGEASNLLNNTYYEPAYLVSYGEVRPIVSDAFNEIMVLDADIYQTLDILTEEANSLQAGYLGQ